nr:MAG TPA: hypothetical protein [Caudoviricetes sp.]
MMMEIVDNFFFVSFFDRIAQKIKYLNTEKVGRTWYDNSVGVGDDAGEANAQYKFIGCPCASHTLSRYAPSCFRTAAP